MKLFVTGAAGKLGHRVVARLAPSHEVVAFDREDSPAGLAPGVRYVQADLRDTDRVREAAAGAEAVVHLGAIPGPVDWVPPSEIFAINVQGTFDVLEAARQAGAGMVVLASSICAVGFPPALDDHGLSYLPVDEDHPCRPRNVYDLSKRLNELTAEAFTRTTGIPTVCLRFPALVDVRRTSWLPMDAGEGPPHLLLGDYLDFEDAVDVIEAVLGRDDLRHEVLFITAETSGIMQPTPEYIRRFRPALEWRGPPPGDTTPLINCARLKRVLDFTPKNTWQESKGTAG